MIGNRIVVLDANDADSDLLPVVVIVYLGSEGNGTTVNTSIAFCNIEFIRLIIGVEVDKEITSVSLLIVTSNGDVIFDSITSIEGTIVGEDTS